jgi:DNA ligase-1
MNAVEQATGSNEKKRLLAGADRDTREFIRMAVDTYLTFGVTWDEGPEWWPMDAFPPARDAWWRRFHSLLQRLGTRELTGNEARGALAAELADAPSRDDYVWATRVLNKDLRSGVSKSIVKKLWPGLIEPFAASLAETYEPERHTPERLGPVFVGPKLDGLRVIVVKGIPYSRNGRVLENVLPIVEELRRVLRVEDWVFDGELLDPGKTFEETVGNARRGGSGDTLVYNVFDMVTAPEWEAHDTRALLERKFDLFQLHKDLPADGRVRVLHEQLVDHPTPEVLDRIMRAFIAAGHEGAMVKRDVPYRFKRTEDVLKMKLFETVDATITGVEEGRGKHRGRMGALLIRLPNGNDSRVGSGFSDAEREEVWAARSSYQGRTVEVQYQNMTAHGKVRFPTFVRFRPDKDES